MIATVSEAAPPVRLHTTRMYGACGVKESVQRRIDADTLIVSSDSAFVTVPPLTVFVTVRNHVEASRLHSTYHSTLVALLWTRVNRSVMRSQPAHLTCEEVPAAAYEVVGSTAASIVHGEIVVWPWEVSCVTPPVA